MRKVLEGLARTTMCASKKSPTLVLLVIPLMTGLLLTVSLLLFRLMSPVELPSKSSASSASVNIALISGAEGERDLIDTMEEMRRQKSCSQHLANCFFHIPESLNVTEYDAVIAYEIAVKAFMEYKRNTADTQLWGGLYIYPPTDLSALIVNFTISYMPSSSIRPFVAQFLPKIRGLPGQKKVRIPPRVSARRVAATIIDECSSQSNREGYLAEMNRYMTINVYGKCGAPCPGQTRRDCLRFLDARYSFFLVLESHLCQYYQSDLLWSVLGVAKNMVPVTFGGIAYSEVLPKFSFVDALNHSPVGLARYLRKAHARPSMYAKYLSWRRTLQLRFVRWPCQLCKMLKDPHSRHELGREWEQKAMRKPQCTRWPQLDFKGKKR